MTKMLLTVLAQVGIAALVLTIFQLGMRLFRLEAGAHLILLTFALVFAVLVVSVLSLWMNPAWLYLLLWSFGVFVLIALGLTLWGVLEPNPSQAVRQGVIVLLFPFIALVFAFPSSAALKWLLVTLKLMR